MCAHCGQPRDVDTYRMTRVYRMTGVGLRSLCHACAESLARIGMDLLLVPDADPRNEDRGIDARRSPGFGQRVADYFERRAS